MKTCPAKSCSVTRALHVVLFVLVTWNKLEILLYVFLVIWKLTVFLSEEGNLFGETSLAFYTGHKRGQLVQ